MKILYTFLALCLSITLSAQINTWSIAEPSELSSRSNDERCTTPDVFQLYKLDIRTLKAAISSVPHEDQLSARNSFAQFDFPMPDGSFRTFNLVEYRIAEEGLMRKFNQTKAYLGLDLNTGATIHFNFTEKQLFAVIRESGKTIYIDPYYKVGGEHYVAYDIKTDISEHSDFECGVHEIIDNEVTEINEDLDTKHSGDEINKKRTNALTLRTYRLAVSTTFGFTNYHGGTVDAAHDAIVTIVNRINSVLKRDAAIRLMLVENNEQLIVTNAMDDPFEDGNLGQMINQNQVTINQIIGVDNYDIGHVFGSASLQGLAQLGAVCRDDNKARGGSVFSPPVGDPFVIAIICHEMGHQFNASHTMYHCHNVSNGSAYEPGSGSTIMSYAGICSGAANIIGSSDDYYHANSLESIINFSRGAGSNCGTDTDFGNTYPTPDMEVRGIERIPVNTPFRLTGMAVDAENPNTLTYSWEQYQAGSRVYNDDPWNLRNPEGNEPIFRSYPPSESPTRYFPSLQRVVNGTNYLWEQLPTYARDLKFRFVVRDNALENGGTAWITKDLRVIDNSDAGVFGITNFTFRDSIDAGGYVELTWDVAATNEAPLNTELVDIYLSTDGGESFPHFIKNTKNDGSTFLNLPNLPTTEFRFMIAASNSVYFNVNSRDGVIKEAENPAVALSYNDACYQICAPDIIEIDIESYSLAAFDSDVHFEFTGDLPAGGEAKFTRNDFPVGQSTKLRVDLREATESGEYNLTFDVSGDNIETITRSIEINVVANDFEELTLDSPVDGATGVGFVPTLEWTPVADAESYTIELSDDPTFNTILFTEPNLTAASIELNLQLQAGGIYYWRVKPLNACGEQDINKVSAFQVVTLSCDEYCSDEDPKGISQSGKPSVSMSISTGAEITVNDFNITRIWGGHDDMGHLSMTLEGPEASEILVFGPNTCSYVSSDFNMGFDDDAAIVNPNCTNFDEGIRFVPKNPLSGLNGLTGSEFTLTLSDDQNGSGGNMDGWCFEVCGDISYKKPQLIIAESITMNNFETKVVGVDKLEVVHDDFSASEISLTIVEVPLHGRMLLNNVPIELGATITMQDVRDDLLKYQNLSRFYEHDSFSFVASDPGGGFLGTPTINFIIGLVGTRDELPVGNVLSVFPNPVQRELNLSLESTTLQIDDVSIFNAHGKQIGTYADIANSNLSINTNDLTPGVYFINVQSGPYRSIRKFIKQ